MGAAFCRWEPVLKSLDGLKRFSLFSDTQQQLRESKVGGNKKHQMPHFFHLVHHIPITFDRDLWIDLFIAESLDHMDPQSIRVGADTPFPLPVDQGPYF